LTLIQTLKIKPFPVILFCSDFWQGFLEWLKNSVLDRKFISEDDFSLLRMCDHPEEVTELVQSWSKKQQVIGRQALSK
jgi:hypothetical protein